jgi:hypothetical protein
VNAVSPAAIGPNAPAGGSTDDGAERVPPERAARAAEIVRRIGPRPPTQERVPATPVARARRRRAGVAAVLNMISATGR